MTDSTQSDNSILDAIRQGDAKAWAQVIDEYQGRLLRFAQSRVSQHADAEDIVQETFASFIRAVDKLQVEVSLETYLFGILRKEIANRFRTRWAKGVCLIQDIYHSDSEGMPAEGLDLLPDTGPSVSWYVCRDEQQQVQRRVLGQALEHLVTTFKEASRLRDLKIAELLFYCRLPNQEVAKLLGLDERLVRVAKHRCLKRVRQDVLESLPSGDLSFACSEGLLTEIWEMQRLSCPKRSTLGAFLLETLPPQWFDYVDFHLTVVGCHFCRASFKDLQEQQGTDGDLSLEEALRLRIMNSTVGFLSPP
ncbi:MAG: sigma-70 family RNA polymerase sigma factor [Sedimentisphaerales bacterium]|nr:sigma-70 family RNA polymerase sigma factor [Sedimentisphaerales bacterium]